MKPQYAVAFALVCVAPIAGCHHRTEVTSNPSGSHVNRPPIGGVAAHGTIVGGFRIVGGPAQLDGSTPNRPLRGTMAVHAGNAKGKVVATTNVPSSGRFSVDVVPGRYVLVGTTPQITGAGGGCPAFHPVTVTAGTTTHVRVLCEVP